MVLGTNNTGAARYTTSGLISSDTVTAVVLNQNSNTTVPATQAAGVYTGPTNGILVSNASGSGLENYAISYLPATLTINQKALTITGQTANSNNALPFQAMMQQAISNMGSFSISRPSGVSVSSPQGVTIERPSSSSTSSGTQIGESKSATSQASANTTLMPPSTVAEPSASSAPRQIMVQIQTAQGVEIVPRSQVSSDSGLNFKVPTAILTTLQVSPTAANISDAKAPVLSATLANGSALPSWIQFDSVTQTFSATQIPSDVKSVTIKLQSKQGQEIIGESVITLSAN